MKQRWIKSLTLTVALLFMLAGMSLAATQGPDEALQMLKKGNQRFISGKSNHPNTNNARLVQAGLENSFAM